MNPILGATFENTNDKRKVRTKAIAK